jgi:hypothetical protein
MGFSFLTPFAHPIVRSWNLTSGKMVDKATHGPIFCIMNVAIAQSAGISVKIVDLLQKHETPIPIDYLAKEVERRPEGIMDDLVALEERGVVKIDRDGHTVALARGASKESAWSSWLHNLLG